MVAQTVGVVQLGAHVAQPGVGGELFLRPDLHTLGGVTCIGVIADKIFHRVLNAGFLHGLRTVQVIEIHIQLAVAAQDVQLFDHDDVQVGVGLLGHHGGRQAGGAAADHDDVALGVFKGGGLVLDAGVGGVGDLGGFQTGGGHGVGHGGLDAEAGEGGARDRVDHRAVGLDDPLFDHGEGPADDGRGVVVFAQLEVGDLAGVKGDGDGQFAVVAGGGAFKAAADGSGVGCGRRAAAGRGRAGRAGGAGGRAAAARKGQQHTRRQHGCQCTGQFSHGDTPSYH